MRTIALVALTGCLLSWTAAAAAQDRIPWAKDWREARSIAQQQHRLVLLHFYSDACAPCKKLERDVFPRAEVARAMSTGYVPVKINVDRHPDLRDHFKVAAWPTDVIVTAQGQEIARSVPSPADANRYIAMLDSARARYGVGNHLNDPSIARNATTPSQPANGYGTGGFGGIAGNHQNNATTSGYGDPRNSDFQSQPAQQAPTNYQTQPPYQQAPQQNVVTNQYTEGLANQTPPQPANPAPRYGDSYQVQPQQPTAPTQGSVAGPYGPQVPPRNSVAPEQSAGQLNPYAGQPVSPNVNQQPVAPPIQQTAPAPAPSQFAMDGFCPVTLVDQGKWQKGDTRWGAVHQGKTYLFASQQGQQQFLAAPDRFAPILSGNDPVRFAETGQLVEGKREHGVFYGNRIFLFADEVALDRFSKHTDFYMARVRQAATSPQNQMVR